MKKTLYKLLIILVFFTTIIWSVDFQLHKIFNIKIMLSVLIASIILTLSVRDKSDLLRVYLYQVGLSSLMATIVLYLQAIQEMGSNMFLPLQPLLYGCIYYLMLSIYLDREKTDSAHRSMDLLSPREQAIAHEVIKGLTNKEIASKLFIAETTVKKHIQNINKKLNTENRQDLIKRLKRQ